MSDITRLALFGKLNKVGYQSMEAATTFCKLRGNPFVELVHWVHQILELKDSDLKRIVTHYELDPSRVASDIHAALDQLPRGATSISDLSSHLEEAIERAWVYATLLFGEGQIRTGHLVVAMLKTRDLRRQFLGISSELEKVKEEDLSDHFGEILSGSVEAGLTSTDGTSMGAGSGAVPGESSGAIPPAEMGQQQALGQFATDLTEAAREGKIDPIVGRDEEIRQIVDILMRRRQNNPILTGEAGVGKTAAVEGFALRLAAGDVPPALRNVALKTLDIGLLQAGASMKGEFENRLRQVIEEVQASEQPIILFIDEAHTLIGAGGAAGTGDAANLLKPALARGTLRTIAATTWAEYKKHIEKDPALTRRFQVVKIDEPSEPKAIQMMRAMASTLENHHRVQVLDEALEQAVGLSHRYIPARQLPDKSVSLLDTACARVAVSQHAVPAEVDDCRKRISALETELEIIGREEAVGIETAKRRDRASTALQAAERELQDLEGRWDREKDLVGKVLDLRRVLRDESPADGDRIRSELGEVQQSLEDLQGESPLVFPTVDAAAVASVVADWTGVPVGRMVKNELDTVLRLGAILGERVIGQDHALETIAKRLQTARAGLVNPAKPIGVFLLAGPSGVGKTETALALAETLYGGEQNLITINMSEFQEKHTVSTLKGSPPGYVGYGEGGVLTEAVRRRPYSVVLLDEIEKAHPDVHELFFQVFDKGVMEDGEGQLIDFKNTVILLTSNVGSDLIINLCKDPELNPSVEGIAKSLREPLRRVFPDALLGRLVTVPYYPLDDEVIGRIARLQLDRVSSRVRASHEIPFTYDPEVVDLIIRRCTEVESGGRMIDSILTQTVLPTVSVEVLNRRIAGRALAGIHVTAEDDKFGYKFL